jgi:predicted glycosyltransferase
LGLGHLRRSTNIAREFLDRTQDGRVLVIADSPAAPFFTPPDGVDYLKLPTILRVGDTTWRASSQALTLEQTLRLRARLIEDIFTEFAPDTVLVDHMPVGALGELKPLLDNAQSQPGGPRFFVGLRDILDRPEVIQTVWRDSEAYDYLRAYEAVLVYGTPAILDAAEEYGLTAYARRIVTCNYVVTRDEAPAAAEDQTEPFILVMGGGGADLFPVAKTFLEAMPLLLGETRLQAAILPGPNLPPEQLHALADMAEDYPVRVMQGFEEATTWLNKATAVVMMAGYNSVCEVMRWQKKALVIPRPGPSAEQRIRTRIFAERKLIHSLDPDELTGPRLARGLISLLADEGVPAIANIPPLDGAERAAVALLSEPGSL